MKKIAFIFICLLCGIMATYGQVDLNNADRETLLKYAEQGNAEAQYYLGDCYRFGQTSYFGDINVLPKDYKQAEKWYLKAIEQGHTPAMYAMGLMYVSVYNNNEKAAIYLKMAADRGSDLALEKLKEIGIDYTPSTPQNAPNSREELLKRAEAGNAVAQFQYGYCCYWGQLEYRGDNDKLPHDYDEAERWFLKSVENGCTDAYFYLGLLYQYDKPDLEKAIMWYKRDVDENGGETALSNLKELGVDYTPGSGNSPNTDVPAAGGKGN